MLHPQFFWHITHKNNQSFRVPFNFSMMASLAFLDGLRLCTYVPLGGFNVIVSQDGLDVYVIHIVVIQIRC